MEGWVLSPFGILGLMFLLYRLWVCLRGEPKVRSSGPVVYCARCSAQFEGPDRMLNYSEHRMSHEKGD